MTASCFLSFCGSADPVSLFKSLPDVSSGKAEGSCRA
jgi:hypothetical protein